MRASINWLKEYVEFNQSAEELADMLTMAGVPVESITYLGNEIEKVVTGRITDIDVHPNADKLSVCKVDIQSEILTIVTGAKNITVGNIIPLALVGAKLPNNVEIAENNLRGVVSQGMMCSTDELNIDSKLVSAEAREGIYILPDDTPLGMDIKNFLGLNDIVLEFELTANRADCFSLLGLAREIAVLTGGTLRKPILSVKEVASQKVSELIDVKVEDRSLCSRFACRVLQDVKVGPSPVWLKNRLMAAGMRPINNVVDVTNFVMLELGQPMHAYDYNLIARHNIVIRKAYDGERITTLDDVKRELSSEMLVITDATQAVGVAGVMGGLATEVTSRTQNVLLEAAAFNGASVRRTSRALGLRSEASGRFERGVDVANIIRALDRAAQLLEQMGACKVCSGIVDVYPEVVLPRQITFSASQVNKYLGINIERSIMIDILKRLEFEVERSDENILVTVPTWRGDVTQPADICEEIARIYGYDNIPSTVPSGNMERGSQSSIQHVVDKIKDILCGAGLDEIVSFSFIHPDTFDKLNVPDSCSIRNAIDILNPITDEFPKLRTTLMGGILDTLLRNLSRKNEDIQIFEIGSVYLPEKLPLENLPQEPLMLCGALMGKRNALSWNQSRDVIDFYDAKGVVETLFEGLGVSDYRVIAYEHYALHPGKTALFEKDGIQLAVVGEVHPKVLESFGINRKVYLFDIEIEKVAKLAEFINRYQPLPKYPAVSRDLAIILPQEVPYNKIWNEIHASAGSLLKELKLFDVYTGEQVDPGCRSMAFSLVFQALDRTLTDDEVDVYCKNIIVHLEKNITAKLRK